MVKAEVAKGPFKVFKTGGYDMISIGNKADTKSPCGAVQSASSQAAGCFGCPDCPSPKHVLLESLQHPGP